VISESRLTSGQHAIRVDALRIGAVRFGAVRFGAMWFIALLPGNGVAKR
jgi:hypothetical protein